MITVYGCGGALVSGTIPPSTHTVLRHTARTADVMVWEALADYSRSTLIVMRSIFQQDIARPHTARVVQYLLRPFQTHPWLSNSPDLSPVEHVWDKLKQQVPSCHSVHDLELAVQDLWSHLPQDNIRCLINSMPDRVSACIAAGGGPTRY
ncbi:uncharacterized protein TNCV_4062881 [Trichonephila clavipes]|nr:uncharacterized protein TNCV_4062881 [Trichonephila clavipes]